MKSANYKGYQVFENGDIYCKYRKEKRKLHFSYGYFSLITCNKMERKHEFVHRILAELFIPNPENKPEVNHINGIKTDNRIENLEWVTTSENAIHAFMIGLRFNLKGSENKLSTPVFQYDRQGNFIAKFGSIIEASQKTKINHSNISQNTIKKRKSAGNFIWIKQ